MSSSQKLQTKHFEHCPLCGGKTSVVYTGVHDHFDVVPDAFSICRCESCALHFTNPQPSANIHLLYPSAYLSSERSDEEVALEARPKGFMTRAEEWYREDQSHFDFDLLSKAGGPALSDVRSYLDVGCGSGDRVAYLHHHGCKHSFGIDPFDFFNVRLDKAKHFLQTEICDFKPSKKFQVLSLFHVLEHVPNPREVIQHCVQHLLEPDGYLLIQVPNYGGMERELFGSRWTALDIPRHFWHFDASFLRNFLQSQDLQVVRIFERNAALHPVTFAASLWQDFDIQRIWVKSNSTAASGSSAYWLFMKIGWMFMTFMSIPWNLFQNFFGRASMLTVVSQKSATRL